MASIFDAARAYGMPPNQTNVGGGQAKPPYLQMRTPLPNQQANQQQGVFGGLTRPGMPQTQPVLTPKPTAPGDQVAPPAQPNPKAAPGGAATQSGNPPAPPQAGGSGLGGLYGFMKSDLENERNQALAGSKADATARGVYYGSPLTGSEADINTQYLRGLGQLQSGMYGNEQQNQLSRLALSTMLSGPMMQGISPGGIDPSLYQMLGQLFGQSNATAGARGGPTQPSMTPAPPPTGDRRPAPKAPGIYGTA